ncbi:glycosyltransferase [Mangrovimonas xylaniphaga]|uniref:glycosyltransferase n=1 Tax=Mangrovimonas xylaniphaga TaxID=1645915 RepID=UPI0006B618EC|nr:glycosyltransferase [Mangrovimonas xylaniphaga]
MKQLLIIGFVWPEPKSSAAGSRMMQLIFSFLHQNYQITFATATAKTDNAFDLESVDVTVKAIELNSSSFDTFVKELHPDIVLFDRFLAEEQFGWRVAEHCPNALRILDTEDLHCLRRGRHQALKEGKEFDNSYLYNDTAKREIASIYRCDISLIISEAEMNLLTNTFKIVPSLLYYLPFLLDEIQEGTLRSLPTFRERQHFVSIGNFLHEPNYNMVLHLKTAIWPLIRKQLPKAELHVYGAYPSQKVFQLHNEKEGFLIKGVAPEVDEVMQSAKVCLVPLQFGAGLKGKLIDAMLNGTPCMMSPIAAEGMFAQLPPNGFITGTPQEFADQAVCLYKDKVSWEQSQEQGFQCLEKRFMQSQFEMPFMNRVEELLKTLPLHRQQNFIGSMLLHHSMQSTKFMSKWIEAKNA